MTTTMTKLHAPTVTKSNGKEAIQMLLTLSLTVIQNAVCAHAASQRPWQNGAAHCTSGAQAAKPTCEAGKFILALSHQLVMQKLVDNQFSMKLKNLI